MPAYDDENRIHPAQPLPDVFREFKEGLYRSQSAIDPRSNGAQEEIARLQDAIKEQQETANSALVASIRQYASPSPMPAEESLKHFVEASKICDDKANKLADLVDANGPERETIMKISKLVRFGHKFADLKIRKDGKEYVFEADWLCRLFRSK